MDAAPQLPHPESGDDFSNEFLQSHTNVFSKSCDDIAAVIQERTLGNCHGSALFTDAEMDSFVSLVSRVAEHLAPSARRRCTGALSTRGRISRSMSEYSLGPWLSPWNSPSRSTSSSPSRSPLGRSGHRTPSFGSVVDTPCNDIESTPEPNARFRSAVHKVTVSEHCRLIVSFAWGHQAHCIRDHT